MFYGDLEGLRYTDPDYLTVSLEFARLTRFYLVHKAFVIFVVQIIRTLLQKVWNAVHCRRPWKVEFEDVLLHRRLQMTGFSLRRPADVKVVRLNWWWAAGSLRCSLFLVHVFRNSLCGRLFLWGPRLRTVRWIAGLITPENLQFRVWSVVRALSTLFMLCAARLFMVPLSSRCSCFLCRGLFETTRVAHRSGTPTPMNSDGISGSRATLVIMVMMSVMVPVMASPSVAVIGCGRWRFVTPCMGWPLSLGMMALAVAFRWCWLRDLEPQCPIYSVLFSLVWFYLSRLVNAINTCLEGVRKEHGVCSLLSQYFRSLFFHVTIQQRNSTNVIRIFVKLFRNDMSGSLWLARGH